MVNEQVQDQKQKLDKGVHMMYVNYHTKLQQHLILIRFDDFSDAKSEFGFRLNFLNANDVSESPESTTLTRSSGKSPPSPSSSSASWKCRWKTRRDSQLRRTHRGCEAAHRGARGGERARQNRRVFAEKTVVLSVMYARAT